MTRAIAVHTHDARHHALPLLFLAGLLLALLAPPFVPHAAAAIPFSTGDQVAVATDVLNVRAAPGTASTIVDRLYEGELVTICAINGHVGDHEWVQVGRTPGVPIGWVAAEYLASGQAGGAVFTAGDRVVVDAGALNFRTGPSLTTTVIRPLAYGALLTITDGPVHADGYAWYQGRTSAATGGDTGWAIGEAMMPAPAGMPDPCLEFDAGNVAHVNTDVLRLRSAPSVSGEVLANLPQGATVTVTGMPEGADGYTWYPVTTSTGVSGWVAGMYLTGGATGGTVMAGSPARVDVAALNIRTGPGLSAGVQGQLGGGTWLMVVSGPQAADGYHWYQVDTANGASGWVIGEALVPAN